MCPYFNYLHHFSTNVHTSCRSESSKYELGHFDSCNNQMFCCLLSFHTIHSLSGIIFLLFITQITLKNIGKQKSWLENSSLFAFFGAFFCQPPRCVCKRALKTSIVNFIIASQPCFPKNSTSIPSLSFPSEAFLVAEKIMILYLLFLGDMKFRGILVQISIVEFVQVSCTTNYAKCSRIL